MSSLQGCHVALATPFHADGSLDLPSFRHLVRHVAAHVDSLVVLGSTGEAATIEDFERDLLIQACLEEAGEKRVLVGTGHNATRQAVAWTRRALELGAQGALVVTPYYNKPTADGLFLHYQAIASACPNFPLVAYNVPGRTGLNLDPNIVSRLWQIDEVMGLKESSGNLIQIGEIASRLPAGKTLLSGDDIHCLASIALGAQGLVSVMGNLVPEATKRLVDVARFGPREQALAMHRDLTPLMEALFVETNPIPLKAGLEHLQSLGLALAGAMPRLPLTPAKEATRRLMAEVLGRTMTRIAIQSAAAVA